MSIFADSTAWLGKALTDVAGESVTLRRGANTTSAKAIRGSNNPKLFSQDGQAYVELRGTEWLIKPENYKFFGQQKEPLVGDRIVASDGTYRVSPFLGGEPCWRWSNQHRHMMRVFTELE